MKNRNQTNNLDFFLFRRVRFAFCWCWIEKQIANRMKGEMLHFRCEAKHRVKKSFFFFFFLSYWWLIVRVYVCGRSVWACVGDSPMRPKEKQPNQRYKMASIDSIGLKCTTTERLHNWSADSNRISKFQGILSIYTFLVDTVARLPLSITSIAMKSLLTMQFAFTKCSLVRLDSIANQTRFGWPWSQK